MNSDSAVQSGLFQIPSSNLSLLEDFLKHVQTSAGANTTPLRPLDLTEQLPVLQMLLTDTELFRDQMETVRDVFEVNSAAKETIARLGRALEANPGKRNAEKVQTKLREVVFGVLKREIQDLDDDDEIKGEMDQIEAKAKTMIEGWLSKENGHTGQVKGVSAKGTVSNSQTESRLKEKLEEERINEQKTKQIKEKLIKCAQTQIIDRQFEETRKIKIELMLAQESGTRSDLTPLLDVEPIEASKEIRELKREWGLEILGDDREFHTIFDGWVSKPMLQVEANTRKVELRANLEKIQRGQSGKILNEGESQRAKRFCGRDTAQIPDTVDLWGEDDYLYEMYTQGNPVYRQIERRVLFPYSDAAPDKGSQSSANLFTALRRDLLCYEREIHGHYEFPGFHRFSRDEGRGENSQSVVVVGRVLKVADSSKIKSQPLTAVLMVFDNDLGIVLRTANFLRTMEVFVFEGQFLAVYGDVVKDFLDVKAVLPFDRKKVLDGHWGAGTVEKLSNGRVKPRTESVKQICEGQAEDQNGWLRSLCSKSKPQVTYNKSISLLSQSSEYQF